MKTDDDLIKLYSKTILELASSIPHSDPLENPMAEASKRSPLCGSNIRVSLNMDGGVVSAFSQDVKACALGQASASILGSHVVGASRAQIAAARDQLLAMLTDTGPVPDAPFEQLEVMQSAISYRNRHASILLAYDATVMAIDSIA